VSSPADSAFNELAALIAGALAIGAPFAIASTGALFSELAGSLNVGIEAAMLSGAFVAVLASPLGAPAAVTLAIAAGCLASAAQEAFARWRQADDFVTGVAANLAAVGAVQALQRLAFGHDGAVPTAIFPLGAPFSSLAALPVVGPIAASLDLTVLAAYAFALALATILRRTPFGIRVACAGMSPESLRLAGLEPRTIKVAAYAISGGSAAFAGVCLASKVASWVPGMTAGYGWISLVVVFLGGRHPIGTMSASVLLAMVISLSNEAQGTLALPAELLGAIPYLSALLAYCFVSGYRRRASIRR
jgi:simple sugar transport system permease protein